GGKDNPTALHTFLASLPQRLRKIGIPVPYQLIVTTNYDNALEEAFKNASEKYDLVYYNAEGKNAGKFSHKPYDKKESIISIPNEYADLPIKKNDLERTIILKVHGAI